METDIGSKISEYSKKRNPEEDRKRIRDALFEQSWKKFNTFKIEQDKIDKMNWNKNGKEVLQINDKKYKSILQ